MEVLENWFSSISKGNLKEATSIYKSNPDVMNKYKTMFDGKNHYQTNAIVEASYQGNRDMVKWLIENHADVNSIVEGGWRPIHFAAQHGHVTTVNLLINGGAEVNIETETKETPIFLALQSYMRDTVKRLLHHGALLKGIDKNFLHSCIQKDVLDVSYLDEDNRSYLNDSSDMKKPDLNGYEPGSKRKPDRDMDEVKLARLSRAKPLTDYDSELKRRRIDLIKKMRRGNEPVNQLVSIVKKLATSDTDIERTRFAEEALTLIETQQSLVPQNKTSDHMINLLELSICDSVTTERFLSTTVMLMMRILHCNTRRGDAAVIDFCCRIFDKMLNLQIEQYTSQILKMLIAIVENAPPAVISSLKTNKDTFIKIWQYFFENLGFSQCLQLSLRLLRLVYPHMTELVNDYFHDVIDILIGWFISLESSLSVMKTLREACAKLHECWVHDTSNLRKILSNLIKDTIGHSQSLARIHRPEKERAQIEDIKLKLKHYCFAITGVMSGVLGCTKLTDKLGHKSTVSGVLTDSFVMEQLHKFMESVCVSSKQIDFDSLLLETNTVVLQLLCCLENPSLSSPLCSLIMRYVFATLSPIHGRTTFADVSRSPHYFSVELFRSYLNLLTLTCRYGPVDANLAVQIFAPTNSVHALIFYARSFGHDLTDQLVGIIGALSSTSVVTTLYQIILSDLELAMNVLVKVTKHLKPVHLVQNNAFKSKQYSRSEAEEVVKYNLGLICLLHSYNAAEAELLVPSAPVLIAKYLFCTDVHFIASYTQLSEYMLEVMRKLSKPDAEHGLMMDYFLAFLRLDSTVSSSAKRHKFNALIRYYEDNLEFFCDKIQYKSAVIETLVQLLDCFCTDTVMARDIVAFLMTLTLPCRLTISDELRITLTRCFTKYCQSTNSDIRNGCFLMYFQLNLYQTLFADFEAKFSSQLRNLQTTIRNGRDFKYSLTKSKDMLSWLVDANDSSIYDSIETLRVADMTALMTVESDGNHSYLELAYAVITNGCWDCVRQKLRFDPVVADSRGTLLTIENIIKYILSNGQTARSCTDKRFRRLMSDFFDKTSLDQAQSVVLLLLFLDTLEKLFYNSYEGCCVGLPEVNKSTQLFFMTNRHVCTEWFGKMRLAIMALAQYAGQWSTVVLQGMQLLHASSPATGLRQETEDCIVLTAMALSKLGNWETLVGLHEMALSRFGAKFSWLSSLADKTRGRLELALAGYERYIREHHDPEHRHTTTYGPEMKLLTRNASSSQSSFILVMEEIGECSLLLADPSRLERWSVTMEQWRRPSQPSGIVPVPEAQKSAVNWGRLACLARLGKWDLEPLSDADLSDISTTLASADNPSWKYRSLVDNCDLSLHRAALSIQSTSLEPDYQLAQQRISRLAALQNTCDFPHGFLNPDLVLLTEKLARLRDPDSPVSLQGLGRFSPTMPLSVMGFHNTLQKLRPGQASQQDDFHNRCFLIKWHRRHQNFEEASAILKRSFSHFLGTNQRHPNDENHDATQMPLSGSMAPAIQMLLHRQLVQLTWASGQHRKALLQLTAGLRDGLFYETADTELQSSKCRYNTKSLLTLFGWLQAEPVSLFALMREDNTLAARLQQLLELAEVPWVQGLPIVAPHQQQQTQSRIALTAASSATDVCSQLLILASKAKSLDTSDKSFMALAQWCLARSRAVDETGLSASLDTMMTALPGQGDAATKVHRLFCTLFRSGKMDSEPDWMGIPFDDDIFIESSVRPALMTLDLDEPSTEAALRAWRGFVEKHFSLHSAAADAYFSFLRGSSSGASKNGEEQGTGAGSRTMANLRLLSLLGKRSRNLRTAVVAKIQQSPAQAWCSVLPQLLARVRHPDPALASCMVELLCRIVPIGHAANRLLVYPALVGAFSSSEPGGGSNPFIEIRSAIADRSPELVADVNLFIREMRRITVLWDELWVSSLGQCYDELHKKSLALQAEIEKIDELDDDTVNRDRMLKLKYKSLVQPALFILERVKFVTDGEPETPRESWFVNTFSDEITNTIEAVRAPLDIREFKDAWKKVRQLQEMMLTEVNNKNKSKVKHGKHHFLSLKLSEISPSLAKMNASRIPLPGLPSANLVHVEQDINIYPTKTKPKKLTFLATDGRRYNYLYKGLEDLRLDERVMQILRMVNTMFGKVNKQHHHAEQYGITTYSVTPFGPRSGLIEMVEDASSLFALYKRHQLKTRAVAVAANDKQQRQGTKPGQNNNQSEINPAAAFPALIASDEFPIRPADIFWQKLRPKLEIAKVDSSVENRDKWPMSILLEVLQELRQETPKDLLSRELWCCSVNALNWFRSTTNFTRSCAVMCMVGHMLGLGDRHLDNLLVNLSDGRMVHIDYNVCFDKGTTLKVPEKVPFRLTDIITDVFGPTGLEGIFKISCQTVLELVSQCHDNILTLMDTFIFEPIVDWSSGVESGQFGSFEGGKYAVNTARQIAEKRAVEFTINLTNLQCSLLLTPSSDLVSCRDKLESAVSSVCSSLQQHLRLHTDVSDREQRYGRRLVLLQFMERCSDTEIVETMNKQAHLKDVYDKADNLGLDLNNRLRQLRLIVKDHSGFFNQLLSYTDFISFSLDMKNLRVFVQDQLDTMNKSMAQLIVLDEPKNMRLQRANEQLSDLVTRLGGCGSDLVVVEKYRQLMQEQPTSFFVEDRCNHMLRLTECLQIERSVSVAEEAVSEYEKAWLLPPQNGKAMLAERRHWDMLSTSCTELQTELAAKTAQRVGHDDELQELETIWQITMFENVAGINVFKAVLLEQYLEMALLCGQMDAGSHAAAINKLPEQISLVHDHNSAARRFLMLLNIHDNLFKISSNYLNMYGLALSSGECGTICQMMLLLHKVCGSVVTAEQSYIDIILPEAVKIMRVVDASPADQVLLEELLHIKDISEKVMLHFNTALTSTTYDHKSYDSAVHSTVVLPIRERFQALSDINDGSSSRQLRILIASFYNTVMKTYHSVCELIDFCVSMTTPSSWTFIDIVTQSSMNISPMWSRSIQLLKDGVYIQAVRCLINSLFHCRKIVSDLSSSTASVTDQFSACCLNSLRPLEAYFNFVGRHILQGIGSQCFSKMFCVLLEQCGWNIDSLVSDNINPACALSAQYLCTSLLSIRKQDYPNAVNFYNQLHFRFGNYKNMAGFNVEANLNPKFLTKNLSFVSSLQKLVKNQLSTLYWQNSHLFSAEDSSGKEWTQVQDLKAAIAPIPTRLAERKKLLVELSELEVELLKLDEELDATTTGYRLYLTDRAKLLSCVRNRAGTMNEVLLNMDRFECMRSRSSERGGLFDQEVVSFLQEARCLLEQVDNGRELLLPLEREVLELHDELPDCSSSNSTQRWRVLAARLGLEINTERQQVQADKARLTVFMQSGLGDLERQLRGAITSEYQPLLSRLKPTLKPLQASANKLKTLRTLPPAADAVLRLFQLLERVGVATDSVLSLLASTTELDGAIDQLQLLHNAAIELFAVLHSLLTDDATGPLIFESTSVRSVASPQLQSQAEEDQFEVGKFGFSNNNMAESNGESVLRISPCSDEERPAATRVRTVKAASSVSASTSSGSSTVPTAGVLKAIEAWRLVEGRIKEAGSSGKDTVARLIQAARSPDNLARMYEGWTAWV